MEVMIQYKYLFSGKRIFLSFINQIQKIFVFFTVISFCQLLFSCENFVEVELPGSQLNSEDVFVDPQTSRAAINAMYAKMRDSRFPGYLGSRLGNYSDELDFYGPVASDIDQFHKNSFIPSDATISTWWNNAYYLIYCANDILEKVDKSSNLINEDKHQLMGESLFIRAFIHFYLTLLFGDIPYVTTTKYDTNTEISKTLASEILNKVEDDLNQASTLLKDTYVSEDRTIPDLGTAMALLARVYLYNQKWQQAENVASYLINRKGKYVWDNNLNAIFLKNSKTTIWQWSPELEGQNTKEVSGYTAPPLTNALTNTLLESFDKDDLRFDFWVNEVSIDDNTYYHPFKYKKGGPTESSVELTVVFRLAEQYLIRSEARAHLNDLKGADSDLNKVRERAGLTPVKSLDQESLLELILQERRHELFTEFGHRFFDLKRTGQLDAALTGIKPGWSTTDQILPLPEKELLFNPNLEPQNPGYE